MIRALAFASLLALAACGQPAGSDIEVRDAWARTTANGQTSGAIYATIANHGDADRLLAVSTDQAAMAMVHQTTTENGVARMRMAEGVDLPAGEEIALAPGGTHIMLEGLKGQLVEGYRFDIQLTFDKGGTKVVPVTVVAADQR